MSLHLATIRKFLRENFKGKNPIRGTTQELKQFGEIFKQRINGMKNISITNDTFISSEKKDRIICTFSINDDSYNYSYQWRDDFSLLINEAGQLVLDYSYDNSAVISDIEEIMSFIAAYQKRIERKKVQNKKRKKLREFKSQAIVAQIKKIAKEDKFNFYTDSDTVKLKLYIQLFEKECIELHIPFNKFQQVLPELRSIILSLKELHGTGIKFRLKTVSSYMNSNWIRYKSL